MFMTRKRLTEEIAKAVNAEQEKRHIYNRIEMTNDRIETLEREVHTLRGRIMELTRREMPSEYPMASTKEG